MGDLAGLSARQLNPEKEKGMIILDSGNNGLARCEQCGNLYPVDYLCDICAWRPVAKVARQPIAQIQNEQTPNLIDRTVQPSTN